MYTATQEEEKREILNRYRYLLAVMKPDGEKPRDFSKIRKAFKLASDAHKDMRRKTGEPYIYHPLEVATICVKEIGLGETSVICALLHDVVEDTDYTLEDIRVLFGDRVAHIIDGLTKIEEIFDQKSMSIQAENFRKILLTLAEDVRVILIKLSDRLHNMRTLASMKPEKQLKIASETTYLYAPLAHRLGLYAIKSELEDLAFKYTDPEAYALIQKKVDASASDREQLFQEFIYPIKVELGRQGLKYEVEARKKSIASIWRKMRDKEIEFEEIYDIFAVRIILDSVVENEKIDCWRAYSIVTDFYSPKQNRLRDWVSTPKANGYESLHTTVMSHSGKWVEVQIRSLRMNEIAEKGYAAHWKYKEKVQGESGLDKWLNRIKELLKTPDSNAIAFLDEFKLNLFADEIFVFTPKGDLKTLPVKSTALDFAYSVHSELGNSCIGAKVNHKLVPLNHALASGDQVEIITSKKQVPREEWIEYVVTARSKGQIKIALKEEHKKYNEQGKSLLNKILGDLDIEPNRSVKNRLAEYFDISSPIELYYRIAMGTITREEIKQCCQVKEKGGFMKYFRRSFSKPKDTEAETVQSKGLVQQLYDLVQNKPETLVLGDMAQVRYQISKCCRPLPGDDVVGIINTEHGIEVHRTNCSNAIELMSRFGDRIVKAKWKSHEDLMFLAGLDIIGGDKKGLMLEIARVISEKHSLNIRSFHIETHGDLSKGVVMLYVHDSRSLNEVMDSLKLIDGINKVSRIDRLTE